MTLRNHLIDLVAMQLIDVEVNCKSRQQLAKDIVKVIQKEVRPYFKILGRPAPRERLSKL